jgi:hypothetical protein
MKEHVYEKFSRLRADTEKSPFSDLDYLFFRPDRDFLCSIGNLVAINLYATLVD